MAGAVLDSLAGTLLPDLEQSKPKVEASSVIRLDVRLLFNLVDKKLGQKPDGRNPLYTCTSAVTDTVLNVVFPVNDALYGSFTSPH